MIKHINARIFTNYLKNRLLKIDPEAVIKSIGTNQTHFIIYIEDSSGKEHKIYIPCEEN